VMGVDHCFANFKQHAGIPFATSYFSTVDAVDSLPGF
jgi:hypothetical protein